MKKFYCLLGIFFLLCSCRSYNFFSITGSYNYEDDTGYFILQRKLIILEDSSFVYIEKTNMYQDTIYGKIEFGKKNLFFTIPERSCFSAIICDTCTANYVNIFDKRTKKRIGAHVDIKINNIDSVFKEYADDGLITFLLSSYDSIKIEHFGYDGINIAYGDIIHDYNQYSIINVYLVKEYFFRLNKWRIISYERIKNCNYKCRKPIKYKFKGCIFKKV